LQEDLVQNKIYGEIKNNTDSKNTNKEYENEDKDESENQSFSK
jgi:hypothetical protein